jgi:hypothetical protein
MDCNLHLMSAKSELSAARNQDGAENGAGSNSNMSTGSDYSGGANGADDKLGKIKVGVDTAI